MLGTVSSFLLRSDGPRGGDLRRAQLLHRRLGAETVGIHTRVCLPFENHDFERGCSTFNQFETKHKALSNTGVKTLMTMCQTYTPPLLYLERRHLILKVVLRAVHVARPKVHLLDRSRGQTVRRGGAVRPAPGDRIFQTVVVVVVAAVG